MKIYKYRIEIYWIDLDVSDEIFKAGVYHIVLRRRGRGGAAVAVHGGVGTEPASTPAGDGSLHQPVAIHEVRCLRLLRDDVRLRPGIHLRQFVNFITLDFANI